MSAKKQKKLNELAKKLSPEFRAPLSELLVDGVVPKKDFGRLLDLLANTFYDIAEGAGDTKKMEKRVRKFILEIFDLNYESEVSDEALKQSVKLIREKIVGRSQREALSELLAAELVANWKSLDADRLETIAGDGGLLERLEEKAFDGPDYSDDELIGLMTELGGIVAAAYCEKLSDEDLDNLINKSAGIAADIESKKKIGDPLLEISRLAMQQLGIIALMRRAFTGLLIGDLILRTVGRKMGLEQDISVTDFIILTGVKIFETEGIRQAEAAQVRRVREAFESAAKIH